MRKIALLLAAAVLPAACTTSPIPEGYKGPTAYVADSAVPRSNTSVDLFYVSKVNGRRIDDSLAATNAANYGRGFLLTPKVIGRNVPAEPSTFTIVGRTHHAAPILSLMSTEYEVSGDTRFTPLPGQSYVVKGQLGPDHSAVWVEDAASGAIIGQKVEVNGSAALGFFGK
jgi:hypothetical protein